MALFDFHETVQNNFSGYRFKQRTSKRLWQKGYYDRIVRLDEALEDYALFVCANAVRAGLIIQARRYRSSGRPRFELMLGGRPEGRRYESIAR